MAKKKIFVSFDFDHDKALKNEIVAKSQNPEAPFKVSNWSMKPDDNDPKWNKEAKFRISRCDIMLVLAGENTHQAKGVQKEVQIARDAKMHIIQIKAQTDEACPTVEFAGKQHDWTWDNLMKLLG